MLNLLIHTATLCFYRAPLREQYQFFVRAWKQRVFKQKKPGSYLLSRPSGGSTIGARGLDFRVRNGNGYGTPAIATGQ